MAVHIRDAGPGDLAVLRGIFRRGALWNEGDRELLLSHPETLEFSPPAAGAGQARVAADEAGWVTGFATARYLPGFLELEDLFVDPPRMGQGVGRALVTDIARMARARGVDRVEVTANPHALGFYERTGFVAGREVPTQLGRGIRMCLAVP